MALPASNLPLPPALTAKRLSELTGVPYSTLTDCIARGRLRAVNIGGGSERARWVVYLRDYIAWIESGTPNVERAP